MQGSAWIRSSVIVALTLLPVTAIAQKSAKVQQVVYRKGNPTLKGYLAKPDGAGPFPVVIYNHGGLGNVVGGAPRETAQALAKSGFVGFSPMRRKTVPLRGHLGDVLAAVDFVKRLDYVDSKKIAVMGFSRGGLLTFMAATVREDLSAVVIMAPAPARGTLDRALSRGKSVSAPALILVAKNDNRMADHVRLSRKVEATLMAARKDVRLIVYPPYGRDGHRMFFEVGDYWKDVTKFLKSKLSLKKSDLDRLRL